MADDVGSYFELDRTPELEPPPRTLAGRYRLGEELGCGSFGAVYAATHLRTDTEVAIKLLSPKALSFRVRREVLALRALRLPGVVRLIEEGQHAEQHFIVMERLRGAPFPGLRPPSCWQELAGLLRRLLEVLSTVHEAGVLHLDLKPGNVMVGSAGGVTLLDFGLALGPGISPPPTPFAWRAGTRRFMAPELMEGCPGDARSDLFAVGRMFELLLKMGAPERVTALIQALTTPNPDRRPKDARDALLRLGLPSPDALLLSRMLEPIGSPDALHQLFTGPDRLFHEAEDAARAAWSAAEGCVEELPGVLERWRRRGWLCVSSRGLRLSQDGRGGLRTVEVHPVELRSPARCLSVATRLRREGRAARSAFWSAQGLWLLQSDRWAGLEVSANMATSLTRELVIASLESERPDPLERALVAVGRTDDPVLASVEPVLEAALALARGELDLARRAIHLTEPQPEPTLELERHRLRLQLAARRGPQVEAKALAEVRPWLEEHPSVEVEARLLEWEGRLAYAQGDFQGAAEKQLQALKLGSSSIRELSAALNAASALLETGAYAEVSRLALHARSLALPLRHTVYEARAEWLLRATRYRSGESMRVDHELVEATHELGVPYLEGMILLTEAAIAWRLEGSHAGGLAEDAVSALRQANLAAGYQLAEALRISTMARHEAGEFARHVLASSIPDVDWQVLGVLLIAGLLPSGCVQEARQLAAAAPDPARRRELLSPHEVLKI